MLWLCHVFCLRLVDDHSSSSDLQINDKTKLISRPIEEDDTTTERKRKGKISKIAGSCFLGCGLAKPKTLTLQWPAWDIYISICTRICDYKWLPRSTKASIFSDCLAWWCVIQSRTRKSQAPLTFASVMHQTHQWALSLLVIKFLPFIHIIDLPGASWLKESPNHAKEATNKTTDECNQSITALKDID